MNNPPSVTGAIRRYLQNHPGKVDHVAEAIVAKAIGGDAAYLRVLVDRIDGPVIQKTEIDVKQLSDTDLDKALQAEMKRMGMISANYFREGLDDVKEPVQKVISDIAKMTVH